jgi:aspartate/methionine/tyrosine aminotransferase
MRNGFYALAEKTMELQRQGRSIIKLNIGETNLPAPEAAVSAGLAGLHRAAGYGPAAGSSDLLDILARRENCKNENIVAGPGSKYLIYALLSILAKPGDTVAFPAPYWPAYPLMCRQLGLRTYILKTSLKDGWLFSATKLLAAKPRIVILSNPNNPASIVYPPALVRELAEGCDGKRRHLIIDEAYKGLAFSPVPDYDAIRVRSFSKEFNLENWRLGYVTAPAAVAKRLVKFNQIVSTCLPGFTQQAGIACLKREKRLLATHRTVWQKRLELMMAKLADGGWKAARPGSGIYIFATHPKLRSAGDFALKLLDRGVAVAPGGSFGPYRDFIRICVNQEQDKLLQAANAMNDMVAASR